MIFGGVGVFLIFGLWLWSLGDEYIWIFSSATLSVYIYLYLPIYEDFLDSLLYAIYMKWTGPILYGYFLDSCFLKSDRWIRLVFGFFMKLFTNMLGISTKCNFVSLRMI